MPRQSPYRIVLSDEERTQLETAARRYTSPYYEVIRAKVVLYAASGMENQEIADRADLPRQIVSKWRKRFYKLRLQGLEDEPRPGRPRGFSPSRRRAGKGTRL
jgi:hypothetical protein